MPVDPSLQFSWPIFRRRFDTLDATPVVTTLGVAASTGDAAFIPELQVLGRTVAGTAGNVLAAGYTIVNDGTATAVLRTAFSVAGVIGAGGLFITVAVSGTELQLTAGGQAGVTIRWSVYWRLMEFDEV